MPDWRRGATHSALGLAYSQLSGTMQAHIEGSDMLPMQIAFNARSAFDAIALAQRDVVGPLNFLEGPFGYFALIDPEWSPEPFAELGRVAQITRLSHKPFPSGRATHGGVDGTLTLQRQLGCVPTILRTCMYMRRRWCASWSTASPGPTCCRPMRACACPMWLRPRC